MTVLKAAELRYSCRKFKSRSVDRGEVEECVKCALLAPSALNKQPWKFYVAEGTVRDALAEASMLFGANAFTADAPAIVAVTAARRKALPEDDPVKHRDFTRYDIGLAVGHFCLRAAELGLGTCIIGWFDPAKVRKILGSADGETAELLIAVGYPADEPAEKTRKTAEEKTVFLG